MSLPILDETIVECSTKFDTYQGQTLKAKLTLYDVPPSNFCGPMPSGRLWAATFFCDDYNHPGGWIYSKDRADIWATEVNDNLFDRRMYQYKTELANPNRKVLPTVDHYYYYNQEKFRHGDIMRVEYPDYSMSQFTYALVSWEVRPDSFTNRDRWYLEIIGKEFTYSGDYGSLEARWDQIFHYGFPISHVAAKDGYSKLPGYARRIYREIHGIKGKPQFS